MLGLRIATLRRSAGMSQSTLAEKLNISCSTVGMYEQGRRDPSADILIALSNIFGVTVDYLLTGHCSSVQDLNAQSDLLLSHHGVITSMQKMPFGYFSRDELAVLLAACLTDQ